jgi:hypothetical protein
MAHQRAKVKVIVLKLDFCQLGAGPTKDGPKLIRAPDYPDMKYMIKKTYKLVKMGRHFYAWAERESCLQSARNRKLIIKRRKK